MTFYRFGRCSLIFLIIIAFIVPSVIAETPNWPHPDTYLPTPQEIKKAKNVLDDPRSLMVNYHPSKTLPPEIWERMTYDKKEMSALWAEVVGFKAQDIVGKVSPEIKPGKYTYKDVDRLPGLKKLLPPELRDSFIRAGGAPLAGNIPEFEIIPTRQFYVALPVGKATKENMGKARLDEQGYIDDESWSAGYPFPQPSGKFKAQQIINNYFMKYTTYELNMRVFGQGLGMDKHLKIDYDSTYFLDMLLLAKRTIIPPFGYYDARAKKNKEQKTYFNVIFSPREYRGTTFLQYFYESPNKFTQGMLYVPSIRRVRKMSSTDTQDPINGQDLIYDDMDGFSQKLSPNRYPYEFELIGDKVEYLSPVIVEGTEYIDSKDGYSIKNVKMMRRPMYVIKLTQTDPNYVYSKRVIYIDSEAFYAPHVYFYDQKGRLYRDQYVPLCFFEENGMLVATGSIMAMRDHIDQHSTIMMNFSAPAFWDRGHFSMKNMSKYGK